MTIKDSKIREKIFLRFRGTNEQIIKIKRRLTVIEAIKSLLYSRKHTSFYKIK